MDMLMRAVYDYVAIPGMALGFRVASLRNPKIREGIAARRDVWSHLQGQLQNARDRTHTAWFHFTSVGEFEQARPIIEALHDKMRIVLTYFSPSVVRNVERYPKADAHCYLPLDRRKYARRLIEIIRPSILIFSKFDIWPNCVWEAARDNIPVVLIAGTLQPKSRRIWPMARRFFQTVHQHISMHCVISESDAARFRQLCPYPDRIRVAGDTRFDRVYERAQAVSRDETFFPGQDTLRPPILVAGSTYREEEEVLFAAMKRLHQRNLRPTLILVPHEPTGERRKEIARLLEAHDFESVYYTQLEPDADFRDTDVLVVDTVGLLAKLYLLGDAAFVGGSFHGSVHNVMEPAALARPLLFGPTTHNAYEAKILQQRGAAIQVHDAMSLAQTWEEWIRNPQEAQHKGQIARSVIEENLGATAKTLRAIQDLLP